MCALCAFLRIYIVAIIYFFSGFCCVYCIVLTFSHSNNARFHAAVFKIFEDDENAKTQTAPVKTYDRCLVKSNTDYSLEPYPTSACILDLMRCSVTFDNVQLLLNGLEMFINAVNDGKVECLTKILRIKNGFKNILEWKDVNDAEYCHVKLSALYRNDSKSETQIVEVRRVVSDL